MIQAGARPILAVDDSAPIREMILSVLVPKGYRVVTAADGRDALERLREIGEPCLILLDVVMPLLDGIAVTQEIERDAELRELHHKIVLMSSSVRITQPDIPTTAGQLVKPFTRTQLLEVVERLQQTP